MAILRPGITLYFIRHGETDWNREARYQGQRDIPLNETGRAQALANGQNLKAHLDRVGSAEFVSSTLSRAVETMKIVRTQVGLASDDFRQDPRLIELHYGHWEGVLAADLPTIDPEGWRAKADNPFGWRPRGGESYSDLQSRVSQWLASLERDTVAVSHGGVSRVARGAVLGLPVSEVPFLPVPQDQIMLLSAAGMSWI